MWKPAVNRALAVGLLAAVTGVAFLVALTFFRKGGFSERDSYLVYTYFGTRRVSPGRARADRRHPDRRGWTIGSRSARARLEIRVNDVQLRRRLLRRSTPRRSSRTPSSRRPPDGRPTKLADLPGGAARGRVRAVCRDGAGAHGRDGEDRHRRPDGDRRPRQDGERRPGACARSSRTSRGSRARWTASSRTTAGRSRRSSRTRATSRATSPRSRAVTRTASTTSRETSRTSRRSSASSSRACSRSSIRGPLARPERGAPGAGACRRSAWQGRGAHRRSRQEQRAQAQAEARGVRQAVDRLNGSLGKLDSMLDKVNEGKSPAGKLLVDEQLGRKVGTAVEGVSDYVDRLTKLQVQLSSARSGCSTRPSRRGARARRSTSARGSCRGRTSITSSRWSRIRAG